MLRRHHLFTHPLPIIHPTSHQPQIYLPMNPSIHHPWIYESTRLSIIQIPICPTIRSSIHLSTHPSIDPSIDPSIHLLARYPFIQSCIHISSTNPSSIHLTVHLPNYAFIHHSSCPSLRYCDVPSRLPLQWRISGPNCWEDWCQRDFRGQFLQRLSQLQIAVLPKTMPLSRATHIQWLMDVCV